MTSTRAAVIQTDVGLGDNLIYSTLPELYASRGMPVFIHTGNRDGRKDYRNPEIFELVWGRNPFVQGICDDPPNAGDFVLRSSAWDWSSGLGAIGLIERAHGFPGTGVWPKIYYEPRADPRFAGKVLIDLSSSTIPFNQYPEALVAYVKFIVQRLTYRLEDCLAVRFAQRVSVRVMEIAGIERATFGSIYEYCDAMFSCEALITVESGAQALASAIRRDRATPRIFALFSIRGYNEAQFVMPNVEYFVTGAVPLEGEFPGLPGAPSPAADAR